MSGLILAGRRHIRQSVILRSVSFGEQRSADGIVNGRCSIRNFWPERLMTAATLSVSHSSYATLSYGRALT